MENSLPKYDALLQKALVLYDTLSPATPIDFANALMDIEGLAMHCPEHHFIVPAALLLSAHRLFGDSADLVERDLKIALTRAKSVPGGFCGNCGCCGAAVGTGIFAAVWLQTNPKSNENWSFVNRMTANSLSAVASVEGPRCCKRVVYLALTAAMQFCRQEMAIDLDAAPAIVCHHFARNSECRGAACPFFPSK